MATSRRNGQRDSVRDLQRVLCLKGNQRQLKGVQQREMLAFYLDDLLILQTGNLYPAVSSRDTAASQEHQETLQLSGMVRINYNNIEGMIMNALKQDHRRSISPDLLHMGLWMDWMASSMRCGL
ncbi:predicted protein [Lichtheimia corymbifera JMRC:FSU:9682]|uniref:Uncharacterized protein n=1 Tax=Lichtheimia corymbifera JMRC:FSU:9682 TaxID=1263082 RepID=A0A068SFH3_9FUNG|nr:predicted protein [Lichtheimia corymbifera JMRC:FSU:9682]